LPACILSKIKAVDVSLKNETGRETLSTSVVDPKLIVGYGITDPEPNLDPETSDSRFQKISLVLE
jgi:hypothetical protein